MERIEPGVFVRIYLVSMPGSRRIDVFEEKNDRLKLIDQLDSFRCLEGNYFLLKVNNMKLTFEDVGQGDSILLEGK